MRLKYKEGEEIGKECPDCGGNLIFEMSFHDCFSYTTGHYTTDWPIAVCSNEECKYYEDLGEEEDTGEYDG